MRFTFHGYELDVIPEDWPKRLPPGAIELCSADWAFSPGSSRFDEYRGWASARAKRVYIWWRNPDADFAPPRFRPFASGPLEPNRATQSFAESLEYAWGRERKDYETPQPDRVVPGFLDSETLAAIEQRVWADREEGSEELQREPLQLRDVLPKAWAAAASWQRPNSQGAGGMGGAIANARIRRAVVQFVEQRFLRGLPVPVGDQKIEEQLQLDPTRTGDNLDRIVGAPGIIRVDVSFPARAKLRLSELGELEGHFEEAPGPVALACVQAAAEDPDPREGDAYLLCVDKRIYVAHRAFGRIWSRLAFDGLKAQGDQR